MGLSLYEINDLIANCFDEETGEILYDIDSLEIARDIKIDNIACFIKSLVAEAEAYKVEEDKLREKRAKAQCKAESLKQYLQTCLDGEKFKSARCSISYRSTKSVSVDDIDLIPDQYKKVEVSALKREISAALKEGIEVPGASFTSNTSMIVK